MTNLPLTIGSKVRLIARPPYLKTADPMPMLRPPDLVAIAEVGQIIDCRPAGYWGVKFQRGTFLLEAQYLEAIQPVVSTNLE
ncbi:MAG: regulatory protein SipA [Synechocystis sp.]|jgi:hypothetical protein